MDSGLVLRVVPRSKVHVWRVRRVQSYMGRKLYQAGSYDLSEYICEKEINRFSRSTGVGRSTGVSRSWHVMHEIITQRFRMSVRIPDVF